MAAGLHAPQIRSEQAFELSLAPPDRGLVIGVTHEGGTVATRAALQAAHDAGRPTAVITVSRRSPAGSLAGIAVETGELDQGWCHTVGYLSPILAASAVGAHLSGRPIDPASRGTPARRRARGTRRRAEAMAADLADADHLLVIASGADRRGRPRARPQGRGSLMAAVRLPRSRDVPARAPAGDGHHDRTRPCPDRPRPAAPSASTAPDRRSRPPASSGSVSEPSSRRAQATRSTRR